MKFKILPLFFLLIIIKIFPQKIQTETIFNDKISIRAIQIWDGKIWYAGTDSKFGYVNLKDTTDRKQIKIFPTDWQFRTLAQNRNYFYTINVESPARLIRIDKKSLRPLTIFTDSLKTAFYDALLFADQNFAIGLSDPAENQKLNILMTRNGGERWIHCYDCPDFPTLENGEAAFAASNTNIAAKGKYVWIATGGTKSRIFWMKNKNCDWEIFDTPFVQGTSSQGIYSIDFYDEKFGIAVGGDYTKQADNFNNIATTNDGGKTWQIQASGNNGGYKTCVKIRPGSKGKDIIAVGDQNIEFSNDFGKTWKTISDEKNLYACEWFGENTVIFAGKDRIVRMNFLK